MRIHKYLLGTSSHTGYSGTSNYVYPQRDLPETCIFSLLRTIVDLRGVCVFSFGCKLGFARDKQTNGVFIANCRVLCGFVGVCCVRCYSRVLWLLFEQDVIICCLMNFVLHSVQLKTNIKWFNLLGWARLEPLEVINCAANTYCIWS